MNLLDTPLNRFTIPLKTELFQNIRHMMESLYGSLPRRVTRIRDINTIKHLITSNPNLTLQQIFDSTTKKKSWAEPHNCYMQATPSSIFTCRQERKHKHLKVFRRSGSLIPLRDTSLSQETLTKPEAPISGKSSSLKTTYAQKRPTPTPFRPQASLHSSMASS